MESLNSGNEEGNFRDFFFSISVSLLFLLSNFLTSCYHIQQDTEEGSLPESEGNNRPGDAVTSSHDASNSVKDSDKRVYLDLIPLRSFLHTPGGSKSPPVAQQNSSTHPPASAGDQGDTFSQAKEEVNDHNLLSSLWCNSLILTKMQHFKVSTAAHPEPASTPLLNGTSSTTSASKLESEPPVTSTSQTPPAKTSSQSQESPKRTSLGTLQAFNNPGVLIHRGQMLLADVGHPRSPQPPRPKAHTIGEVWESCQC